MNYVPWFSHSMSRHRCFDTHSRPMHYNTGYQREAIPLVRHFTRVFDDAEVIVASSASCVGMVRDLYPRAAQLSGDGVLLRQAPSS